MRKKYYKKTHKKYKYLRGKGTQVIRIGSKYYDRLREEKGTKTYTEFLEDLFFAWDLVREGEKIFRLGNTYYAHTKLEEVRNEALIKSGGDKTKLVTPEVLLLLGEDDEFKAFIA